MKIVFLDTSSFDFTVETPFERALGGSQSAACYLAIELARLGHAVALVSNTSAPGHYRGVECPGISGFSSQFLNRFDVVVAMSFARAIALRSERGITAPLVLWTQHAVDQAAIQDLRRLRERKAWAGFAFVSEWQLNAYVEAFFVPRERSRVLRNAMSPPFAALTPTPAWFETGAAPILVYTSTPFRGLDVLLDAFPAIRAAIPDARLRVFSSMATYHVRAQDDRFGELYRRCANLSGAEYVGSVGQTALARELAGAAALAYPSTFAETSCISAIEAMAAGAVVLTTRLGALPETTAGFAPMIEPRPSSLELVAPYAQLVIDGLSAMRNDTKTATERRMRQIRFMRENYTWPARAAEWVTWLSRVLGS
jgi:glycosyltransferase involved in cell wall biosynthesis